MIKLKIARKVFIFLSASLLISGSVAQAQTSLNVKIGLTSNNGTTDGAYQETGAAVLGSANSWWNEYQYKSSTPNGVSVVDSSDNALSGVTLTVANSTGTGTKTTSGSNPSFLFGSMPYQNAGGIFTVSLTGLLASTEYEFVGYAARPTSAAGASWAVTTGTLDSGTTLNDGSSVDVTTGVGKAYSDFFVTTTSSGDLTVTDTGNPGTAITILDGFQLEVATAPVPEPGTWTLIFGGLGALFAYRQFKVGKVS